MKMIAIQVIPLVAVALWTIAYQLKSRKHILVMQMAACVFWTAHFALLEATAGTFFSGFTALRFLLFSQKTKSNWISSPIVLWAVLAIQAVYTVCTIKTPWEIFVLLGVTLGTIAAWQDNPRKIRMLFVPAHFLWITYDVFVGSWGGAISEGILAASTLVALLRKDLK